MAIPLCSTRVVVLGIFAISRIVSEFSGTGRRLCCATASVCVTLNFIFPLSFSHGIPGEKLAQRWFIFEMRRRFVNSHEGEFAKKLEETQGASPFRWAEIQMTIRCVSILSRVGPLIVGNTKRR